MKQDFFALSWLIAKIILRYTVSKISKFKECTYANLDSISYYTPIAPRLQTCSACYCTECCKQL